MSQASPIAEYTHELHSVLFSRFELMSQLAQGSFGSVYKTVFLPTNEILACKILSKEKNHFMFLKMEILALNDLKTHPYIITTLEMQEDEWFLYLFQEFCVGGDLYDAIPPLVGIKDELKVKKYFSQILDAVGYMHCRGYVHRDLKPENIMLDKDDNVRVIDFGLCGLTNSSETDYGSCVGTFPYMSPEMYSPPTYPAGLHGRGHAKNEEKSDVWSLGILLFTMLEGEYPWAKPTHHDYQFELFYDQNMRFDKDEWLPPLHSLIALMLELSPKRRIFLDKIHPYTTQTWLKSSLVPTNRRKKSIAEPMFIHDTIDSMNEKMLFNEIPNNNNINQIGTVSSLSSRQQSRRNSYINNFNNNSADNIFHFEDNVSFTPPSDKDGNDHMDTVIDNYNSRSSTSTYDDTSSSDSKDSRIEDDECVLFSDSVSISSPSLSIQSVGDYLQSDILDFKRKNSHLYKDDLPDIVFDDQFSEYTTDTDNEFVLNPSSSQHIIVKPARRLSHHSKTSSRSMSSVSTLSVNNNADHEIDPDSRNKTSLIGLNTPVRKSSFFVRGDLTSEENSGKDRIINKHHYNTHHKTHSHYYNGINSDIKEPLSPNTNNYSSKKLASEFTNLRLTPRSPNILKEVQKQSKSQLPMCSPTPSTEISNVIYKSNTTSNNLVTLNKENNRL